MMDDNTRQRLSGQIVADVCSQLGVRSTSEMKIAAAQNVEAWLLKIEQEWFAGYSPEVKIK